MDDYISRQAAITEGCDAACGELKDTCTHPKDCGFWMGLMNLPAADVVPIVHGNWIIDGHHMRCDQCGIYMCLTDREGDAIPKNFCPNCGADMR